MHVWITLSSNKCGLLSCVQIIRLFASALTCSIYNTQYTIYNIHTTYNTYTSVLSFKIDYIILRTTLSLNVK